jgi:nucleotide-binding universal stress UspA family protein
MNESNAPQGDVTMASKTIVFPTDFSDVSVAALQWAMDMASTLDAQILCIYVVEEPQIYSSLDMGAVAIPTTGDLVESAKLQLQKFVADHLSNATHGAESKVVVGHAATEIVETANESGATMIIMATHGYGRVKHAVLGSTTEDVVRRASCPVLSVRSTA